MPDKTEILSAGQPTGATFTFEMVRHCPTIRFHSRGTTEGTRAYRAGLVLLLDRLTRRGIKVTEVCVETRTTTDLSRAQRCIFRSSKKTPSLNQLVREEGSEKVRKMLNTESAKVGRPAGAKGGGNGTKQLRFYLEQGPSTDLTAAQIVRCVAGR